MGSALRFTVNTTSRRPTGTSHRLQKAQLNRMPLPDPRTKWTNSSHGHCGVLPAAWSAWTECESLDCNIRKMRWDDILTCVSQCSPTHGSESPYAALQKKKSCGILGTLGCFGCVFILNGKKKEVGMCRANVKT